MANEQNLIPLNKRTKSEAREISRKGGLASGRARKRQADLKKAFETILPSEVNNEQMKELLLKLGYEPTNAVALAMVMTQKAMQGNVQAFAQIMKYSEESSD